MQTEIVIVVNKALTTIESLGSAFQHAGDAAGDAADRLSAAINRHAFCADKYGIRVYAGSATIETRGPGRYFAEVGYGNF